MEINGLGFINPEDFRLSAPSPVSRGSETFMQMLERARNANETNVPVSQRQEPIDRNDRLFELCLELETFIVKNLLSGMRNTVQKSGLIDDSFAGKIYEDMLWDEYAKDFTKNAGFGLAEQAYRQLSRYT